MNKIPGLLEKLESIDKALKSESDLVEKLEDIRLSTVDVFDSVDKLRTNNPLKESLEEIIKTQEAQLEQIDESKEYIETSMSNHMLKLSSLQDKIDKIMVDGLEEVPQNIVSKINGLAKEFDEVKRAISHIPTDAFPAEEIKAINKKIDDIEKKLRVYNSSDRNSGWSIFGRR